jgi:hypothetical protein
MTREDLPIGKELARPVPRVDQNPMFSIQTGQWILPASWRHEVKRASL